MNIVLLYCVSWSFLDSQHFDCCGVWTSQKLQNRIDLPLLQSGIHFYRHGRVKYWNLPEKRSKRKLATLYIYMPFGFRHRFLRAIDVSILRVLR